MFVRAKVVFGLWWFLKNYKQVLENSQTCLQRPTLGPSKSGLSVFQRKLQSFLVWLVLGWPLLTGGRYSEVIVNTGLTLHLKIC